MNRFHSFKLLVSSVFLICLWISHGIAQNSSMTEHEAFTLARKHFYEGTLKKGLAELEPLALKNPDSAEIAFAQGSLQVASAIENLGQSLISYGFSSSGLMNNIILDYITKMSQERHKEIITYQAWNNILNQLREDLDKARVFLAKVSEKPVSFKLEPARIRFDINGDGEATKEESLWLLTAFAFPEEGIEDVSFQEVTFDGADAAWLRGYSSLVMAKISFLTGYNTENSFKPLKELLFNDSIFPLPQDAQALQSYYSGEKDRQIASVVMMIHSINWPVNNVQRISETRTLLKDVISMSRLSWKLILKRTDSSALRWIPGPGQKSVLGEEVSQEMVTSWQELLTMTEDILDGKKLIPTPSFWYLTPNKGVNLRQAFENPQPFDLIGLITGHKALPFIEEGHVLPVEKWNEAAQAFRGKLLFFALWFN